jgi:hypothetical protein
MLIHLVHEGGSEKVVDCTGMDHERAFVVWPVAGVYDVELSSGKLLGSLNGEDEVPLRWRVRADDLGRLRQLQQQGEQP